ncbi:tetraspanin-17-like [Hydractinia symbiolongicarpus]|uniref:tetraspanin-17-like n=1 Tax=Hydractinia symbiolongicarpus TaxID=13093 RepID=UPI00254D2107|nr:tetraspanin-17-like [Hydractinia symbiolongicarpus]
MPVDHQQLERRKSGPSEVSLTIKYVLFSLNVLFWIIGAIMIGVGVYAKTEKAYGGIGDTLPWFMDPANIFIIIGSIVFTLAFIGCIGSLRENIALLRTFEYTIDILLLLEVALVIYVYLDRKRVRRNVEEVLKETIPKYRDDPDLQSIIDWVQETMKCCGIQNVNDWDANIYFNCSTKASPESCGVPYSCCRNYGQDINTQCGYGMRLEENTSKKRTTIYVDGCVDATIKYFLSEDNLILLVCVGGAMVLLQLITTGLAHHLVDGIRRQKANWNTVSYPGTSNQAYH